MSISDNLAGPKRASSGQALRYSVSYGHTSAFQRRKDSRSPKSTCCSRRVCLRGNSPRIGERSRRGFGSAGMMSRCTLHVSQNRQESVSNSFKEPQQHRVRIAPRNCWQRLTNSTTTHLAVLSHEIRGPCHPHLRPLDIPDHHPSIHSSGADLPDLSSALLERPHSVDAILMHRLQLRIIHRRAS